MPRAYSIRAPSDVLLSVQWSEAQLEELRRVACEAALAAGAAGMAQYGRVASEEKDGPWALLIAVPQLAEPALEALGRI
jgi:hypothetical protein